MFQRGSNQNEFWGIYSITSAKLRFPSDMRRDLEKGGYDARKAQLMNRHFVSVPLQPQQCYEDV